MDAVAKLKNCPMSPRKMRLVVNNIRGKEVGNALNILRYTKNEGAVWLRKVLLSAIANWEFKADGESADDYGLYVKTAFSDGGATMKRFRPATHGRAARIHKRTNHITIVVANRAALESETTVAEEAVETAS